MIELTRLNGHKFSVNCDLIKFVEEAPDTTLTLVTGEKLLVMEARETVVELSLQRHAELLRSAWPGRAPAVAAKLAFDLASEGQSMSHGTSHGTSQGLTQDTLQGRERASLPVNS